MQFVQYSYIISSLCIPFLFLIFNHTNKIIKWGARGVLIGILFYIIAIIPFVILSELKYWSILLVAIPIMFRIISILLDRIGLFGSKSISIVENLMFASISALSIIFVGASSNTLEKLVFLILILFILNITDFKIIEKYKYMSMLFGPIVAVLPTYDNFNIFFTVVFIWLVMTISFDVFLKILKIKKSKRIEKSVLIVFVTVSLIIANHGGVSLNWTDIFLKVLAVIIIGSLLLGSSFLINQKVNSKYPIVRQYCPVVLASLFFAFLMIMINLYQGVRLFFDPILIIIILLFIIVCLGRLISPLDKITNIKSFPFRMDNISEMMNIIFGQNLGRALFKNLFGEDYRKVHSAISILFMTIVILVGGSLLFIFNTNINLLFFDNDQSLLAFLLASSMFSAIIMLSEIVRIANVEKIQKGISIEDAIHSSTLISLEYFSIFIPLLLYYFNYLNTSYIFLKVFGGIFMFLFYANINIVLFFDFQKPLFNDFKRVRIILSSLLQGLGISLAPILFFATYRNEQGLNFITQYYEIVFIVSFIAMFIAKLISYDTEFGSKKIYKRSLKIFIFSVISFKPMLTFSPFFAYLIFRDETKAFYFAVLFIITNISLIGREMAIILLPWSNHSTKTIVRDWLDTLKNIKAEQSIGQTKKNVISNKPKKRKK